MGQPEGAFLAGRAVALLGEFKRFDVVIVIDTSGSTNAASGADINGNGVVGASGLSGIFKQTDPGDSILAAEVAAAKKVLESLDPRNTRVGLVTFAGTADQRDPYTGMIYSDNFPDAITEEPLTTNYERVVKALDRVFKRGPDGMTNMTEGVRQAVKELKGYRGGLSKPDRGSQKVVIFFTDGQPTAPYPTEFKRENVNSVLRAASQARRADVQVHTFAIGEEALEGGNIACVQLAAYTGGYFQAVMSPGDLPAVVDTVNFANLEELAISNVTNGEAASETIINADGSFGALVPVQPGLNRLRVVATATDGTKTEAEVTVSYAPGAPSASLPRELVAMRNRLLERRLIAIKRGRIETERQAAEEARKELEIKIKNDREKAEAEAEKAGARLTPRSEAAETLTATPACVMVKGCPATVRVALRGRLSVLGRTVKVTAPLPRWVSGGASLIQGTSTSTDQTQSFCVATTSTLAWPPSTPTVCPAAESEKLQAAPLSATRQTPRPCVKA